MELAAIVVGAIWVYVMGVVATVHGMDRFKGYRKGESEELPPLAFGVFWPVCLFLVLPVAAGYALGNRGPISSQAKDRRIAELEKELEIK